MQIIVKTMSELISKWNKEELGTSTPHGDLLLNAIADFQDFSSQYENYFESLINNKEYDPAKTTDRRLRYQYTQTLQNYWSSLEQVILQWQVAYYRDTLRQAYERATQHLQNLNLPLTGTLIYFNKVANIRYLPFTQIPILGIPHPLSGTEGFSAIPHEIGHYVYWNLGSNIRETQHLQKQLKTDAMKCLRESGIDERQREFVIPWLEEIFSDVVGTRVDGRGFVASSDQFVRTQAGNKNDLILNDGHHPPLLIRPFIWYRALKPADGNPVLPKLNEIFDMATLADFSGFKIQASSPIISEADEIAPAGIDASEHDFETFNVSDLLSSVEKVVDFLSEKLDEILPNIHVARRKESAFQELKQFVTQEKQTESKFKDQELYEILLRPRALEEGVTHTHGINIPFHGWHESTTHSH